MAKQTTRKTTQKRKAAPKPAKTAADVVAEIKPKHNGSAQVLPEVDYHAAWVQCPGCGHRAVDTTNAHGRRDYSAGIIRYHTCPKCGCGFRSKYMGML